MWRIEKVQKLIQQELGKILLKEIDFPLDSLATITRVYVPSNLEVANVYISVFPEEKTKGVIDILNKNIYDIQQFLNKKLRMRPVPKIQFFKEKKIVEAARIEQLLFEAKDKNSQKDKNCDIE
ncbi:MAG: 30S ribosome-binding factor RbfA [Candidatus Paceibacterota bacterium]|jgi:ribosome-binding factor A|nr:30S ribosome-binding factor RbfA [Candidatus Paceibacterota bacterium]MDD4830664.1 30S ribosome-binding factor RbfA [Candidatus Paceibacterota bacterium]MDD4875257.1 30S ribosome-binding factor RbfA [Candidatus Paceibacterota bacterium]